MKVLILEDELIIAKDIQILLKNRQQIDADVALHPKEAMLLFSQNQYDLVISDINLNTDTDGVQTVMELNRIKKVPIIFLTAYSDQETVNRVAEVLPFAYLLKPFNNNQLLLTINLAQQNFKKAYDDRLPEITENTLQFETLTSREKEVLIILSSGKIAKEIAAILSISSRTVEKHIANIKAKLQLNTAGELVNFCMSANIRQLYQSEQLI